MNAPPLAIEVIVVFFGLYMARHSIISHKNANESRNWPMTSGKIIVMELWGRRNIDGRMVEAENLKVKYEYEINNKKYVSKTSAFYTLHYPEAMNFFNSTRGSRGVDVYYNPLNPAQSVLIRGPHPNKPHGDLILGSVFIVIGLAPLLYSLLSAGN